jgi:hypothetical protein
VEAGDGAGVSAGLLSVAFVDAGVVAWGLVGEGRGMGPDAELSELFVVGSCSTAVEPCNTTGDTGARRLPKETLGTPLLEIEGVKTTVGSDIGAAESNEVVGNIDAVGHKEEPNIVIMNVLPEDGMGVPSFGAVDGISEASDPPFVDGDPAVGVGAATSRVVPEGTELGDNEGRSLGANEEFGASSNARVSDVGFVGAAVPTSDRLRETEGRSDGCWEGRIDGRVEGALLGYLVRLSHEN